MNDDMRAEIEDASRTAIAAYRAGSLRDAVALIRQTADLARAVLPPGDPLRLRVLQNAAALSELDGDPERALAVYRELAALAQDAGDALHLALASDRLFELHRQREELPEAVAWGERSLALWRARQEPFNATVLGFMTNLASVHFRLGRDDEAERLAQEVLEQRRLLHGEESEEVAQALVNLGQVRRRQGALTPAESLLRRALDVRRRLFPAGDPRVRESLQALADLYEQEPRKALPYYEEIAAGLRRDPAADKIELARVLNNLATLHYGMGEVARSRPLYEESLQLVRSVRGDRHPEVATLEGNLANVLRDLGDLDAAEELNLRSLAVRRATLADQHPETAASVGDLRELYRRKGSAADLERLYGEVFASVFETYQRSGTVTPAFADALRAIARDHRAIAGTEGAAETSLARQAAARSRPPRLAFQRKARARKLFYLAELLVRLEELDVALPLLGEARDAAAGDPPVWWRASAAIVVALTKLGRNEEAVAACEAILGEVARGREAGDEELASILRTKASAEWALDRRSAALETIRRATDVARAAFGEGDARYADALVRAAELERSADDLEAAGRLAQQAVEIARAANAGETAARGGLVLAELARRRGSLAEAEALYDSALATLEAVAPDSWRIADALGDLASLYLVSGRAGRATALLERAAKIKAAIHGEPSPQFLAMEIRRAEALHAAARLAEAVELYRQVAEKAGALGDTGLVAHALFATGVLYVTIGADDAAQSVLTQALELWPASAGEGDRAALILELAVLVSRQKRFDEALARIDEALALLQPSGGAGASPLLRSALTEKARTLARADRLQEAFDCLVQSSDLLARSIREAFATSGEREREDLAQELVQALDSLLTWALRLDTAATRQAALDRVLQWKAIALDWTAQQAVALSRAERAESAILRSERSRVRSEIAARLLAGPADDAIDDLRRRHEALDLELSRRAGAVSIGLHQPATASAVAEALPPGAVLVEYVRFKAADYKVGERSTFLRPWPARYLVFVLPSRSAGQARMFDLGEADEIDAEVRRFRAWITAGDDRFGTPRLQPLVSDEGEAPAAGTPLPPLNDFDDYLGAGRALRRKLLDPVLATLASGAELYIALDGDLAGLPFAALPLEGDDYLIDRHEISFLNSGRELLRARGETAAPSAPLVIADPDFDLALGDVAAEKRQRPFPRLDGTRAEGEAVAALLGVRAVLDGAAVEERVRQASSPVILHLATHGFFLTDDRPPEPANVFEKLEIIDIPGFGQFAATASRGSKSPDEGPAVDRFTRIGRLGNPLLRSGIALAGANTWVSGGALPAEAGDGLVTAEEICALDFRGTELAVLSACETGLGEVREGEGVYGLRRAFTIAGARTLVMSLWKVPDEQTKDLMIELYRRIRAGEPRGAALRAAQIHVRQRDADPVCWAGFVCFGDRSPLGKVATEDG